MMKIIERSIRFHWLIILIILSWNNVCAGTQRQVSIDDLWMAQSEALHRQYNDILALDSAKRNIKEYLLDNGIKRSPLIASAYVVEARNLLHRKKAKIAVWACNSALEIDPVHVSAAKFLLKSSMKNGLLTFFSNIPRALKTYYLFYRDTLYFMYFFSDIILLIIFALFIFFSASILTFSIKYIPLWVHEIEEHLPSKWKQYFSLIIAVTILLMPLFFRLGFVWLILWLFVLCYIFLEKAEIRIVWMVTIPLLFALPANILRTAIFDSYNQRYLNVLHYAEYGGYSRGAVTTLLNYSKSHGSNHKVHFLLGLLYKRGGHYFDALKEYLEYTRLEPGDAKGHVNLGNIYFILNNINEAISEYRRAVNLDRNNPITYVNLSRAYLHQFKFEQATETLNKASQLDPVLVTHFTDYHSSNPNRLLVDCSCSIDEIGIELSDLWTKALVQQDIFWYKLGPGLGVSGTAIMMVSVVFLLLILHILKGKFLLSRYCIMCGQAICHRCQEGSSEKYCSRCQMMFFKKSMTSKKEREKVLREISVRGHRKWLTSLILSILMPGTGNFFRGDYKKGIFILGGWSLVFSSFFVHKMKLFQMHNVPPVTLHLGVVLTAIVVIAVYFSAVFSVISGEEH